MVVSPANSDPEKEMHPAVTVHLNTSSIRLIVQSVVVEKLNREKIHLSPQSTNDRPEFETCPFACRQEDGEKT
jgi:hypothetical protein